MDEVGVEVDDIETVRHALHFFEHDDMVGNMIPDVGVEAKRLGDAGHQCRRGRGIATRKQGNVVALPYQVLSEE